MEIKVKLITKTFSSDKLMAFLIYHIIDFPNIQEILIKVKTKQLENENFLKAVLKEEIDKLMEIKIVKGIEIQYKAGDMVCYVPTGETKIIAAADNIREKIVFYDGSTKIYNMSDVEMIEECDKGSNLRALRLTIEDEIQIKEVFALREIQQRGITI